MLNAESFRIPQELELIDYIRVHPALVAVCSGASAYRQASSGDGRDDVEFLTRNTHLDLWQAVSSALELFGVDSQFSLVAAGKHTDSYRNVRFRRDGSGLVACFSRVILQRLDQRELTAAIGHGLGHLLFGHHDDPDLAMLVALARGEASVDGDWEGELWDNPISADLLRSAMVLAHLQDLSADRIGMLVARDLQATIMFFMRTFLDVTITPRWVGGATRYAIPVAAWAEPIIRPHPSPPTRMHHLEMFAASELYRRAVGLGGGLSVTDLAQRGAPFLPGVAKPRVRGRADLDDLLLELILMDSLISAGRQPRPRAERMLLHYLPPGSYEQVIERYDRCSAESDLASDLLRPWFRRAAHKPWQWKLAMVERFLYLVSLDHRIDDQALGEVATLAQAMGAREECGLVYAVGFGYDPFHWVGSEDNKATWQHTIQALLLQ